MPNNDSTIIDSVNTRRIARIVVPLAMAAASLVSLSTLAKANGGEVWLFIYPWPAQLKYESRVFDWEKFAADLCTAMACQGVIDTFPALRAVAASDADWYSDLFVFGDSHYNKFGNEILAGQLLSTWPSGAVK